MKSKILTALLMVCFIYSCEESDSDENQLNNENALALIGDWVYMNPSFLRYKRVGIIYRFNNDGSVLLGYLNEGYSQSQNPDFEVYNGETSSIKFFYKAEWELVDDALRVYSVLNDINITTKFDTNENAIALSNLIFKVDANLYNVDSKYFIKTNDLSDFERTLDMSSVELSQVTLSGLWSRGNNRYIELTNGLVTQCYYTDTNGTNLCQGGPVSYITDFSAGGGKLNYDIIVKSKDIYGVPSERKFTMGDFSIDESGEVNFIIGGLGQLILNKQ